MDVASGSAVPGYDPAASAAVIDRALQLPGGADLVAGSLGAVPGAVVVERRKGVFRSSTGSVQLGRWRYSAADGGRLAAAHVVGGIVLAQESLSAAEAGGHVAEALRLHLVEEGPRILPDVLAVMEGLSSAAR